MRKSVFAYSLILISVCCLPGYLSAQSQKNDSLSVIKAKIRADYKEYKERKGLLLKAINTADSFIIYGSDKRRTRIDFVRNGNFLKRSDLQFKYYSSGRISIEVLKRPGTAYTEKIHPTTIYYFENKKLIFSIGSNEADDLEFLLSESDRNLKEGTMILKSLGSNPIPKI